MRLAASSGTGAGYPWADATAASTAARRVVHRSPTGIGDPLRDVATNAKVAASWLTTTTTVGSRNRRISTPTSAIVIATSNSGTR